MRFVDLFAGLGGFHQALSRLGHQCVFASELNATLANTYKENFGLIPHGDIRSSWMLIPDHDILCAGFPCQPFSKAGGQLGFNCPESGDLFGYMLKILELKKPTFLIIENVPNLMKHAEGATWKRICNDLCSAGYEIRFEKLSPHMFGIPQNRERTFIVGSRIGLAEFVWPEHDKKAKPSIRAILDVKPNDAKPLPEAFHRYLDAWQKLLTLLPEDKPLPSFPIWAAEFGATYPIVGPAPVSRDTDELDSYLGSFGQPLHGLVSKELAEALPPYSRGTQPFPLWKIAFIRQNREFYVEHKAIIDEWLPSIQSFPHSFQKFEWNWKGGPRDISQTLIQFRASGIRVKQPTTAPSLVALTTSQIPVIGWERRFMTTRECARLQSMGNLKALPQTQGDAFKALGNAVNVEVVHAIAKNLLSLAARQSTPEVRPKRQSRATEPSQSVAITNLSTVYVN